MCLGHKWHLYTLVNKELGKKRNQCSLNCEAYNYFPMPISVSVSDVVKIIVISRLAWSQTVMLTQIYRRKQRHSSTKTQKYHINPQTMALSTKSHVRCYHPKWVVTKHLLELTLKVIAKTLIIALKNGTSNLSCQFFGRYQQQELQFCWMTASLSSAIVNKVEMQRR